MDIDKKNYYYDSAEDCEIIGLEPDEELELMPKIKIIGVGGAGSNMVDWLYKMGIQGAELIAINTDYAHLKYSVKAHKKILIGKNLTKGLGTGGIPERGAEAAKETISEIKKVLKGADMVWILLGLGGGTGTGAGPIVAKAAKEIGIPLVISVATLPFKSEGVIRIEKAEQGLTELRKYVDNVLIIDNNKILEYAGNLPINQAFGYANNIIGQMIQGLVETIQTPSLINLDFADIKTVLSMGGGASIVGIGVADDENRAKTAAKRALELPLLDVEYEGASGAIIHVEGDNITLAEVNEAAQLIQSRLGQDTLTILGARLNERLKGKIKVTTIISGVKSPYILSKYKESEITTPKSKISKELGIDLIDL